MAYNFILLDSNTGVFAPIVGYAGTIIAASYAFWALIWRSRKVWETPQGILPRALRGLLSVLIGVGILYIWLTTTSQNLNEVMQAAIALSVAALFSFLFYFPIVRALSYKKIEAISSDKTVEKRVVGGFRLRPEAKEEKKQRRIITVQELFEGSAYDEDKLWTRASQEFAKSIIVILYISCVFTATVALVAAGVIMKIRLENMVPSIQ